MNMCRMSGRLIRVKWALMLRQIVDGERPVKRLSLGAGDLYLFGAENALHRVSPVEDDTTRQLAVYL